MFSLRLDTQRKYIKNFIEKKKSKPSALTRSDKRETEYDFNPEKQNMLENRR